MSDLDLESEDSFKIRATLLGYVAEALCWEYGTGKSEDAAKWHDEARQVMHIGKIDLFANRYATAIGEARRLREGIRQWLTLVEKWEGPGPHSPGPLYGAGMSAAYKDAAAFLNGLLDEPVVSTEETPG